LYFYTKPHCSSNLFLNLNPHLVSHISLDPFRTDKTHLLPFSMSSLFSFSLNYYNPEITNHKSVVANHGHYSLTSTLALTVPFCNKLLFLLLLLFPLLHFRSLLLIHFFRELRAPSIHVLHYFLSFSHRLQGTNHKFRRDHNGHRIHPLTLSLLPHHFHAFNIK
jgi:hypothetical protein